jgi:hypothetical protein
MKFKLSYKIFVAFTLTSLMVVALMVGIIRFYVARNFADYVNTSRLERYGDVADALAAEYQTHKGWQSLKDNGFLIFADRPRGRRILKTKDPGAALKTSRRQGLPGELSDWPAGWRFLMLINSISSAGVSGFHMTAISLRKLRYPANAQAG